MCQQKISATKNGQFMSMWVENLIKNVWLTIYPRCELYRKFVTHCSFTGLPFALLLRKRS